jgi:hypothetical protein
VGFIKKVMKLLQHGFPTIRKVEVTLTQLEQSQAPLPTRPCEWCTALLILLLLFSFLFIVQTEIIYYGERKRESETDSRSPVLVTEF